MKWLPIHLWCCIVFTDIGDICGGFVEIDDNWGGSWEYVCIRITERGQVPSVVEVDSGKDLYRVQVIEDFPTILTSHRSSNAVDGGGEWVAAEGRKSADKGRSMKGGILNLYDENCGAKVITAGIE